MTLTARPVRAAADEQVGLARQERGDLQDVHGLRRGGSAWAGSWMSVRIGSAGLFAWTRASIAQARIEAGAPERASTDVRLALSNDALKMSGTPQRARDAVMAVRRLAGRACRSR